MSIKEHVTFLECWRQFVLSFALWPALISWPAAGIGDELTLRIVNRNHGPPGHDAATRMISNAKVCNSLLCQPSFRKIRMSLVKILERELQGRIHLLCVWLCHRNGRCLWCLRLVG